MEKIERYTKGGMRRAILEIAPYRSSREVVRNICLRLQSVEGDFEVKAMIEFYLSTAPQVWCRINDHEMSPEIYSLAVQSVVSELLSDETDRKMFMQGYFPFVLRVIPKGKNIPENIRGLLFGLNVNPLLFPEEYSFIFRSRKGRVRSRRKSGDTLSWGVDIENRVREICTSLRKLNGSGDLGDIPVKVALYLRSAPRKLMTMGEETGRRITYTMAVSLVVEKLLDYEMFDEFMLRHYPSLIEDVICGRLPEEIKSLIEELTKRPPSLPSTRESFDEVTFRVAFRDILIAILEIFGLANRFFGEDTNRRLVEDSSAKETA